MPPCATFKLLAKQLNDYLPNKKNVIPGFHGEKSAAFGNMLVHNYLGEINPLSVMAVIKQHLQPLEFAVREMLQDQDL